MVLSQYVEQLYARELMQDSTEGVGYLLKDRVSDVLAFVDAVRRVAAGGTVLDPKVGEVLLFPPERGGIGLRAEGRSTAAIAGAMFIPGKAVDKHINSIFMKLDLPLDADDNRRVLAVLRYLQDTTADRPKKGADLA